VAVTLRAKYLLSVYWNRVLRRVIAPYTKEVIRVWRKIHDEEIFTS